MKFGKRLSILFVAAALLLFSAQGALAAKVIKMHHLNKNGAFDNPSGAAAVVFKNLVESGTNGSVQVQIFPSGQLGKDAEVVQQVKAGIIQLGVHSVGGVGSVYPMISVLDVPFAFPNHAVAYEVLDGPFGQKLGADITAKTGLKCLGFSDSGGFFQFTNSKRPIKTLEDMKGLKIRTMGLETHKKLVASLGGQPVSIAWSEVYTSLQTGVADGQMNPVPIVEFAKLYEVQKYLTISNHLFAPHVWLMNADFYGSLTDAERAVVESAAKTAIVVSRGIANAIEASDRGLPFLSEKMEVYTLPEAEKERFRAASLPVVKEYLEGAFGDEGKAMLASFLDAIKAASK
ncbi:DctP family TRAP transporter solute-binding subunit [Pseudodesulfovibrio cashew]|uniref:DctP family TRAP transporter solute-binding subunit n=1 Tax=Pseudodesulfovibrio cashew TaxID=2678688 RepID=A0A6I6J802_9BACT|nr:DctP family TRAP transporter solute-binding subunit [Pseudodesulfovibrio cashew]QGY38675.1 DctP family TRAP transporter solute-binding subunit [Pseudodesulfovibrio cashew]